LVLKAAIARVNHRGKPVNRKWQRKIVEMLSTKLSALFPKIFNVDVFDRLGIYRCARRWTFMEAGLSRIKKVLAVMSNAETRGTHVLGWLHS